MLFLQDLFNFGVHVSGSVPTLTDSQNANDLHLSDSFLAVFFQNVFFLATKTKKRKKNKQNKTKRNVGWCCSSVQRVLLPAALISLVAAGQ